MVEEWYIPVKFFDEYIVQISFGVDYLNQNNQNISNKYDPISCPLKTWSWTRTENKDKNRKKLNIHQ